jgi:transposase-like protein
MAWNQVTLMEQKQQFVSLAATGRFTFTELCADYHISRKTGHKWLGRYRREGLAEGVMLGFVLSAGKTESVEARAFGAIYLLHRKRQRGCLRVGFGDVCWSVPLLVCSEAGWS